MKYSVIVLVDEKHSDFHQHVRNIHNFFSAQKHHSELLIIANGCGNFIRDQMSYLLDMAQALKVFEFNSKTTPAVCINAALQESSGEILVILEAYQQISNESLAEMIEGMDEETDIVLPWRKDRVDSALSRMQSNLFNSLVRWITKSQLHDLSSTVRVCRREVVEETELYGNMYRFLPLIAAKRGFRTKEIVVTHRQERGKTGFYGFNMYLTRLIDIFALYFNTRFTKKPLRFFSAIGICFMLLGSILAAVVFVQRTFMDLPVGNRPILFVTIFLLVLGVNVMSIGLLGEIITFTHGRRKKEFVIDKEI